MRDVERLSSEDESVAKEAFDRLNVPIRGYLGKNAVKSIANHQDREDIITATCLRIWKSRLLFTAINLQSWKRHLHLNCQWCAIDFLRRRNPETTQDNDVLDYIAQRIEENATEPDPSGMYNLADRAWLGWRKNVPPRERRRLVLAAQLFYLEGLQWEDIAPLVKLRLDQRQVFDEWLEQDSTLMHMAFLYIYMSDSDLRDYLLDGPHEYAAKWNDVQRFIIQVRFGHPNRIPARYRDLPKDLVEETVEICKKLFPFCARAKQIRDCVLPPGKGAAILNNPNLWKRVVFQYMAHNDLPQQHILERVQPVAVESGATMTANTLQAWISSHRLSEYLQKFLEDEQEEEEEE